MDRNKEGNVTKSEKPSEAPHSNADMYHHHHDWAFMQAYCGPRITAAIPQYDNSNVANGHAPPPPYMWWPSPWPPYWAPHPLFCSPGGVYAHPGVQMGSQSQGPVSQATPAVTTPLNLDDSCNSPGTTDHGFLKKLQVLDELTMSLSNNIIGSSEHRISEYKMISKRFFKLFQRDLEGSCDDFDTASSCNDASTNGSDDGNATGGEQTQRKRRREGPLNTGERPSSQTNPPLLRVKNEKPDVTMGTPVIPIAMGFQNSDGFNGGGIPQPWNEKKLKREKRKQSNRESAQRSRLRKQAETDQLAAKADALVAENMTLRSKVSQLKDESEKLRVERKALLDQLKKAQATAKTENLVSKVDKNNSEFGSKKVLLVRCNTPITDPAAATMST